MTDDSEDLSATMKALDKEMADAERWALGINDLCDGLLIPKKFDGFKRAETRQRQQRARQRNVRLGAILMEKMVPLSTAMLPRRLKSV